MGEVYAIDNVHITTVRDGSVELTQVAEMGAEGTGTIVLDDTAGTTTIVGQMDVAITQSSCANPRTWSGFVDDREFSRDAGIDRAPHVGAARGIAISLVDLNQYLSHMGLIGDDNDRPAETCQERFDWLVASNDWPAGVAIGTRIDIPDRGMTESDYRYGKAGDVLADIAMAAGGLNYYVADWGSGPELTFRNDNTSTDDTSDVRISNVLTDVDSSPETLGATKTFAPSVDFKLNRSPREVWSEISGSFGGGTETEERPATATAFNGVRHGTATNSNIKSRAKARDWVHDLLWIHSTERDFLEGSITVPSSAVNLVRAGERMQVKFSHMVPEGYSEWTWVRVMERTVKPLNAEAAIYEVRLRLSPQEEAPPAASVVQSVFGRLAAGGSLTFPNPVTIGNLLVYCVVDRQGLVPGPPTTAALPRWGPGAWTDTSATNAGYLTDGVRIYTKTADATDQTGGLTSTDAIVGCFELAGADIASATVVTKYDQAAAATMDLGSLGTPVSGSVAIMVGDWFDQANKDDAVQSLSYTARDGWTLDILSPSFYGSVIIWNAPCGYIAHQVTDGSAVTAGGTRGALHHLSGLWGGAAIVIPPL